MRRVRLLGAAALAFATACSSDAPSSPPAEDPPIISPWLRLNAVSPDSLVEGGQATLSGAGFSSQPAVNHVMVDGVAADVVSATSTSLTIAVPRADCRPARTVEVRVEVGNQGAALQHPLRPAAFVDLPVGQQIIIPASAESCLQFAPSAADEAYLIGAQSVLEDVSSLTPVEVTAATTPAAAAASAPAPLPAERGAEHAAPGVAAPWAPDDPGPRSAAAAEARLRQADRRFLSRYARAARAARGPSAAAAAAPNSSLPPTLDVGQTTAIRVPGWEDQCNEFTEITAIVRAITPSAVWLEDVDNPAGGYNAAQFEEAGQWFDDVYDVDTTYLGQHSDLDGNGRVAIVVTKEVNRIAAGPYGVNSLNAFVKPVDYIARQSCPASNEGEILYLLAPDPAGMFGGPNFADTLAADLPRTMAHEFAHVIQFSHEVILQTREAYHPNWFLEGQAVSMEEVAGHRAAGRTPGQNYGYDVAYDGVLTPGIGWYALAFTGPPIYYGFESPSVRVANAPEQCSWIGMTHEGNDGPCIDNFFMPYGVTWLFLRWLSDQFGPGFPGGEAGLHRALLDHPSVGFAGIEAVVGVPMDSLLAQWAAMHYVDDRVPGAAPRLTLPSWNLFDVNQRRRNESARLVPRERPFADFADAVAVRGGSAAYFRVSGAGRPATSIRARGTGGAPLPPHIQLWVVRLQ
jgi:hypothetical protein